MDIVSGSTNPAVSLATALYDIRSLGGDAAWIVDGLHEQIASPEEYPAVPFDARQIELIARLHRALRIVAGCEYAPGAVGEVAADVLRTRMSAMVEPEVFETTAEGRPTVAQRTGGPDAYRELASAQLTVLRRLPCVVVDAACASLLTGESRTGSPAWAVAMCAETEQLRDRLDVLERRMAHSPDVAIRPPAGDAQLAPPTAAPSYGRSQAQQGIAAPPSYGEGGARMTSWNVPTGVFGTDTP